MSRTQRHDDKERDEGLERDEADAGDADDQIEPRHVHLLVEEVEEEVGRGEGEQHR